MAFRSPSATSLSSNSNSRQPGQSNAQAVKPEIGEELPGFQYDPVRRRYFRITQPGHGPAPSALTTWSPVPPESRGFARQHSSGILRHLLNRPVTTHQNHGPPPQVTAGVLAASRVAVWPPPLWAASCPLDEASRPLSVVVRRPQRVLAALLSSCPAAARSRKRSIVVHTACAIQGFHSQCGVLEETRRYRLSARRMTQSAPSSGTTTSWQTALPSSLSAACDTKAIVQLNDEEAGSSVYVESAVLIACSSGGQLRLLIQRRRLLPAPAAADRHQEVAFRLHWPCPGGVDRGDILTDLQLAGPTREVALSGRRAAFALASVDQLATASSGVRPLCIAASPIIGLEAAALPGSSRLLAVCSLKELLVADARSHCLASRIAAASSAFTSCRFLIDAHHQLLQQPTRLVVNTAEATLVYDIRRSRVPVAELRLPDPDPVCSAAAAAVSHKASWLVAVNGLIARTDPSGSAVVWEFTASSGSQAAPLLTMRPPVGGLSVPTFLADSECAGQEAPRGLAILELPGDSPGCDECSAGLALWPISI